MTVVPSMRAAACGILLALSGGPADAQTVIPESDRFIRSGTRMPALAAGEGGHLDVTASSAFCADATHVLEIRFFPDLARERPVVRVPAGPSACRWEFADLAEGFYAAVMQVGDDGAIVAQAHGQILRGATTVLSLESSRAEVQGRVTGDLPVTGGVRLAFAVNGGLGGHRQWTAQVHADGTYRVTLPGMAADDQICIRAEPSGANGNQPAEPLGSVSLKCARFVDGLNRLDFDDVHLPPGIVRIEVPPVADAAFDAFADLTVAIDGTPGSSVLRGFKLLRGLRAECFADYQPREFAIVSHGPHAPLSSSRIVLTAERPVQSVTLTGVTRPR